MATRQMDTSTIGSKIAKARKATNMSQAQLAQSLFISPQAVGKWERGESAPDIITINRVAEILGVDLNYFSENFTPADEKMVSKTPNRKNDDTELGETDVTSPVSLRERELLMNFSGSELPQSDFEGVIAHKRKFNGSNLRGANFAGADLTGSSFVGSDLREVNFDGTNLTDCTLSATDLTGATFNKTILVRTEFSKLGLARVKFTDVIFTDVKLTVTDLRETIFENCIFNGVDFNYGDLRGLCLDGQTFTGVRFDKTALNEASFKGAILKNVSFRPTNALTNKYYRAVKTVCFDGATMDKLTFATLKGIGADLSKVTII